MESTPNQNKRENSANQAYRDTLAEKLRQERNAGNTEKAQRILNEQRGTEFYKDAQEDHRSNEQYATRNESITKRIEQLGVLKEKINAAKERSANETPAETIEEKTDVENAQEGFDVNLNEIEVEQETLATEQAGETAPFENNVTATIERPKSQEKYGEWSDEELRGAYQDNKAMIAAAGEHAAASHKDILKEIEDALAKRGLLQNTSPETIEKTPVDTQEYQPTTMDMEQEAHAGLNDLEETKTNSISTVTENENGGKEVYFDGAKETDFDTSKKETAEDETAKKLGLAAIIASAQKSLNWLRGKNAPWATPSMIAREKRKLRQTTEAHAEGKETQEDKKTIAAALVTASERNQELKDKAPARSNWLKRNWGKVVAGGALFAALMFTPKGCDFVNADEVKKDKVEKVIDNHEEVKDYKEVCGVIDASDGITQVAQKAFASDLELAKKVDVDVNSPESLKAFGERIKVIDVETGNEIRLGAETIGGQIDFRVYDSGRVVAFFKYNPDDPAEVSTVRGESDPFTKFEKQSDKEYVQQNESIESKTDKVLDKMVKDSMKWSSEGIELMKNQKDKEDFLKATDRWDTPDDNSVNDPGTANPFNVK